MDFYASDVGDTVLIRKKINSFGLDYDCYLSNNGTKEDLFKALNLIVNL